MGVITMVGDFLKTLVAMFAGRVLAGDMGVELAEIVPVVPDPVEQGPQPTDSMSLPDDAIEIIEVTECKGLTGKEPYYIHPTPSEPKNDEVK